MKIHAYIRVSHRNSADSGLSVRAQRNAISEYCKSNYPGVEIEFYEDLAVSAWKVRLNKRPSGGQMLKNAKAGDVVIAFSIDRGFRNLADFASTNKHLVSNGIRLEFANGGNFNENAGSQLIANIIASVAEYSSSVASERIREAKAISKLLLSGNVEHRPRQRRLKSIGSEYFAIEPQAASEKKAGRVYGYARCSHIDSLNSGLGLRAQDAGIEKAARKIDGEWMGITSDEAISAFKVPFEDRPGASELLAKLSYGDHVVIYRLDRAWRNVRGCLQTVYALREKGIHFHIVDIGLDTSKPESDVYLTVLSLVAQMESEFKSKVNKAVRQSQIASGLQCGVLPVEAKVIRTATTKQIVPDMEKIAFILWIEKISIEKGMASKRLANYIEKLHESHDRNGDLHWRELDDISERVYGNRQCRWWTTRRIDEALDRLKLIRKRFKEIGLALPDPCPDWRAPEQLRFALECRLAAC